VVAAVIGCGDEGTSREEFAARAQEICARGTATTGALQRQVDEAARLSDPALVFRRTAVLQRKLAGESARVVDALDATEHPPDDEGLHAWMATVRRARSAREELADAYGGRDLEEIARAAARVDELEQQADRWARANGMPACAEVP
jgi:hypothetical protein